jgi:hypothetical protein
MKNDLNPFFVCSAVRATGKAGISGRGRDERGAAQMRNTCGALALMRPCAARYTSCALLRGSVQLAKSTPANARADVCRPGTVRKKKGRMAPSGAIVDG